MKRFWRTAEAQKGEGGWTILLDGKPLRTPAKAALKLPTKALAEAISAEWGGVKEGADIDPRAMPLTGFANAAIDHIAPNMSAFAATIAKYAEADLACYRAEGPRALVEQQDREWDGLLAWARRRFDVDFTITAGLAHVAQPQATIDRLAHEVTRIDAFRLAGMSPLVTIGGSLVAALAVLDGGMTADQAWEAVSLDDRWQIEQWGADTEAEKALANRRNDFLAAAHFLDLLGD